MALSVIVPWHNEEENVGEFENEWLAYWKIGACASAAEAQSCARHGATFTRHRARGARVPIAYRANGVNSEGDSSGGSWVRLRGGRVVYSDTASHVSLVVRTLGIEETAWAAVLDRYAEGIGASPTTSDRMIALADAYRPACPHAVALPAATALSCSACGQHAVRPAIARRSGESAPPIVYGACGQCGHGQLSSPAAPGSVYEGEAYFQRRAPDGVGYEGYEREQRYREAKGARLLDWIERNAGLGPERRALLEVGSGFGFTLAAAARRGWRTAGVDVNPAAARAARRLCGVNTVTATLERAMETGDVPRGAWDVVLYQFVLEHLSEPAVELRYAAQALAPGGLVAFVVPNMSTFEVDVFGASYRSLRADHRHLFSVTSARKYLAAARLVEVAHETTCSLHLLRGFLEPGAIDELYAADRGPDLLVLARRVP